MENISKYDINGLLFKMPLYEKLNIGITKIQKIGRSETRFENFMEYEEEIYEEKYPKDFDEIIDFLLYEDDIYGYCNKCKKENSLKSVKINVDERLLERTLHGQYGDDFDDYDDYRAMFKLNDRIDILLKKHEYFTKSVNCSHKGNHKQIFIYKLELQYGENEEKKLILQKIGQDPSNIEFHNHNIRDKYSKYKNYKNIKSDLNKAVISYENNFAVGGFLYLRRVLEKIVDYKYEEVKCNINVDNQARYEEKKVKFIEKIDILKAELPEHLTENTYIYSILSAGVHSLTEEECSEYFSVVEKSVYFILDELLQLQKRNKLNKKIQKDLNIINSKIKK
ncbi:hypothetical protein [Clostridium gasigenes]|uniref:Uncharacterized protein n=1 Tax=Clostridium gasigenes TaxID=94869 RepID=A0A1H0V386_9CLOT|nr:hypothetical protein [Clostridium gasigenes]SDP72982.1 hypothetical protein SAMN04488529_11423 [Clostridium gasigenes]